MRTGVSIWWLGYDAGCVGFLCRCTGVCDLLSLVLSGDGCVDSNRIGGRGSLLTGRVVLFLLGVMGVFILF